MTPDEWHARNHVFPGPSAECRDCARQARKCAGKVTYVDITEAAVAARRINVERDWTPRVRPYFCRYCSKHHLATAKGKHQMKKAERDRRKWLRGREMKGA